MNLFQKYGIKEVADVVFYSITAIGDEEFYTPVLFLDTLKVSTLEKAAEKVEAKGGKGNKKLITWNFGKEITLNLEDALFSPASMSMIWGGKLNSKLSDYTSAIVKCNMANKYGDLHYSIKAYPSPALTDSEWEIIFKKAEETGLDSGCANDIPYKYCYSQENISENQAYIEENRQTLIKKYFTRNWDNPTYDSNSFNKVTIDGREYIDYSKMIFGDTSSYSKEGYDNRRYTVTNFSLIFDTDNSPSLQDLLDKTTTTNFYETYIYFKFRYNLKLYESSYYLKKRASENDEDQITNDPTDRDAIFEERIGAILKYNKSDNKIIIEDLKTSPNLVFYPYGPSPFIVGGYSAGFAKLWSGTSTFMFQEKSYTIIQSIYGGDNVIKDNSFSISISGKAMPQLVVQELMGELNEIDKIGTIETDIHDLEVIDRMEKCIVKNRKGLTINTLEQKQNLFKYYLDDKSSSYTIYYDAKTMLPLFRVIDGKIDMDQENFTIKMGTVYYKWTRTVKYKESEDDAILGKTLVIDAETFPDAYKIVGETYVRNQKTGKDQRYQFTIFRANVSSDTSVTLEAEGDPTTFSMQIDVLTPPNDIMMELKQYDVEDDPIEGGTRIVPQKSKYTYTPANVEYIEEVADKNEEIY